MKLHFCISSSLECTERINLPDCSHLCHESLGTALTETIGIGKGPTTLNDLQKAEIIIIMGQNSGTTVPRMLTFLERAKRNGAKIIAVNPSIEVIFLAFKSPQDVRDLLTGATTRTNLPASKPKLRPGTGKMYCETLGGG